MRWRNLSYTLRKYSKDVGGFHIGIIGAGPAGFYCAQQLLKVVKDVLRVFEINQNDNFNFRRFRNVR